MDLFLQNVQVFRGCATQYNSKNIGIISPSFNGKTTLVNKLIQENNETKYYAEDMLVCNFDTMKGYPTAALRNNYGRSINEHLDDTIKSFKKEYSSFIIDKIYLIQNTTNTTENKRKEKTLTDFLLVCSLFFLNNTFIRSYISEENLFPVIINNINDISKKEMVAKFTIINNFNFDTVFN